MTSVLIALPEPHAAELGAQLERIGLAVVGVIAPSEATGALLAEADAIILPATRAALSA